MTVSRIAILLLEDSALDAELVRERLARTGFDFAIERVDDPGRLRRRARGAAVRPDPRRLLAAGLRRPGGPGHGRASARPRRRSSSSRAPWARRSPSRPSSRAATDYVLKQRLERLGPAVRRALDEARERTQRLAAQRALAERSVQLQRLAEISTRVNIAAGRRSVVRVITEEARGLIRAHQAVTSLDEQRGRTGAVGTVSLSEKYAAWRGRAEPPRGLELHALVARQGRPVRMTQRSSSSTRRSRARSATSGQPSAAPRLAPAPLIGRSGKNPGPHPALR